MKLNNLGISLIKSFEKCVLHVYPDAVGLATVGYGHRTNMPLGASISQDEADRLLAVDLSHTTSAVEDSLMADLNDNQFSACVCLAFNIGAGAFAKSTLVKLLNQGDTAGAANEFPKWDKAKGKELAGLKTRRLAEQKLFNS